MPRYWLMKSEPDAYGWDDLVTEGEGTWDGVRNYRARNNLAAMEVGDLAFFYHSNIGKEIVGVMEIVREAYPDKTDDTGRWVMVDVVPVAPAKTPQPIVDKLSAEVDRILKKPEVIARFRDLGAEPVGGTPASLGTFIDAETKKWEKVVKDSGAKID